jgi:EF hand
MEDVMQKIITGSIFALLLASSQAFAQTAPPATAPKAPAAGAATPVQMDPASEAKFKAADKDNSGSLEGPELEPLKSIMDQVDTDKDGKVSRAEYAAAVKAGLVR